MLRAKADWFNGRQATQMQAVAPVTRTPYFCSGCPHNTSTKVPEGSRAFAGIGCHFMALWMDRSTETYTHMGGEGVPWVGVAPFTKEEHVFANLGDGTYFHSGSLAIRQAVASGANITYKLLYNDATAMTGGQHVDGELSPQQITFQLHSEGIRNIYLVSETPRPIRRPTSRPASRSRIATTSTRCRRTCRTLKGTSAIVFVQTCAAEKRRRRKRGLMEDPARRVMINPAVCEGCGDCSVQSNCISVEPLETEMGRKRTINQSTCNKDYSCVKGFCPSFVTIDGGKPRRRAPANLGDAGDIGDLPEPASFPSLERPYNIAVGGVGGTGVLTIGALLGMAAHIEGKASMILDMSGLAQKGGAVLSHVRLSEHTADVTCSRIVTGTADLVMAADEVVAAAKDTITLCEASRTVGVINTHVIPTATSSSTATSISRAARSTTCWRPSCARTLFLRFHQARRSAARRFHRHQHHDAGLCLSEGPAAAVGAGDYAGDRGQRRLDQDEHAGLPARPSRRRRSARLEAMMKGKDESSHRRRLDAMTAR
jgi:indolepyruvate ferredoxin oxidoreductase